MLRVIIFRARETVCWKKSGYVSARPNCGRFSPREVQVLSRNANRKSITADIVRANNFALKLDSPENGVDARNVRREEEREAASERSARGKSTWDILPVFIYVTFDFTTREIAVLSRGARNCYHHVARCNDRVARTREYFIYLILSYI